MKRQPGLIAAVKVACLQAELVQESRGSVTSLAYFAIDDGGRRSQGVEVIS